MLSNKIVDSMPGLDVYGMNFFEDLEHSFQQDPVALIPHSGPIPANIVDTHSNPT